MPSEPNRKPDRASSPRMLLLSQVYVPDPASVGQHLHDAAVEMVNRGWNVRVLTSARGYDDPSVRYDTKETRDGVEIHRLGLSSFGKKFIALRVLAGVLFMLQTLLRGVFGRRPDMILVSTSPPMCSIAAAVIGTIRRVPIKYWVMDLNPDQMIELGRITEKSLPARIFNAMNRMILKRSRDVVALDRFMADRLNKKLDVSAKMQIMPPWPHDDHLDVVKHANNPFRKEHNLNGKFVVMYSGNHGYSTPVRTILDAALKMQDRDDLVFMFIGGGVGKKDVDDTIAEHKPSNIVSLPYQPIETLRYSLSAADVHLVSVGNDVVGVVHPCKIYGAMAVARPILLLGPDPCHVSDLVRENNIGWQISHGDIDGAIETLETIRSTPTDTLEEMGARASHVIQTKLSKKILCGTFCDVLERGFENGSRSEAAQSEAREAS